MDKKIVFVGLLIIILVSIYYNSRRVTGVKSDVDGNTYYVAAGFDNKSEAANMIGRMNLDMLKFLRFLKNKYHIDETDDVIAREGPSHPQIDPKIYGIVDRILNNYNPEVIVENNPLFTKDTSFTIMKGESLHLCVRNKKTPTTFVDYDLFFFVSLHELAHMGNLSIGHGEDFWEVFKFVLHEASLSGVYTPIDYEKYPLDYCGLFVNYSPLYDDSLRNIWETSY